MNSYEVMLTHNAQSDLREIYTYISTSDSAEKANYVLSQFEQLIFSLEENPHRGSFPKELLAVGLREFRELYFKPYRVIYSVSQTAVFIYLIADGRRDMQALLQHRLLS